MNTTPLNRRPLQLILCVHLPARECDDTRHTEQIEFDLLPCLPRIERAQVLRFLRLVDRLRTLVSRLLQRIVIASCLPSNAYTLHTNDEADSQHRLAKIRIARNAFGKPFLSSPSDAHVATSVAACDALQFNVSHHGDWVMLAARFDAAGAFELQSHSSHSFKKPLLGCDVVSLSLTGSARGQEDNEEEVNNFIRSFDSVLCSAESDLLFSKLSPLCTARHRLERFYIIWSHKEAIVKAIGLGLSFDLALIDTSDALRQGIVFSSTASHYNQDFEWQLQTIRLDSCHYASIVKAEPRLSMANQHTESFGSRESVRITTASHDVLPALTSELSVKSRVDSDIEWLCTVGVSSANELQTLPSHAYASVDNDCMLAPVEMASTVRWLTLNDLLLMCQRFS